MLLFQKYAKIKKISIRKIKLEKHEILDNTFDHVSPPSKNRSIQPSCTMFPYALHPSDPSKLN